MAKKAAVAATGDKNRGKSTIITCTCANLFQDKMYGRGRRVANITDSGARCTICSKEKT